MIGGRILRMSKGSDESAVMPSLGFVRNPAVPKDDYKNEARWCRLLPSSLAAGHASRAGPDCFARVIARE